MKRTLIMLTMVTSAWAGDCCECDRTSGGWMYELMFGRENRRQEARRQETFARWQAETDRAIADRQGKIDPQGLWHLRAK